MEDPSVETVAGDLEFTPKAIEEPLVESCYTIERKTPKGKITKKKSKTDSSKSKASRRTPRRFRRLRKALSFSRSKSDLSDQEMEKQNQPKPKRLIMPPAPRTTKPAVEDEDKYPIPPNPTAAGSGRSVKRKELDLLSVEIQEMEEKIKRQGTVIPLPMCFPKNQGFRKRMFSKHTSMPAKICKRFFPPFLCQGWSNLHLPKLHLLDQAGIGGAWLWFLTPSNVWNCRGRLSAHELLMPYTMIWKPHNLLLLDNCPVTQVLGRWSIWTARNRPLVVLRKQEYQLMRPRCKNYMIKMVFLYPCNGYSHDM